MITGRYVPTFELATHALPQGLHLSADYPFKLPAIKSRTKTTVTLTNGSDEITVRIIKANGREWCNIDQKSAFENAFHRKPTRFKCLPFKDEKTAVTPADHCQQDELPGFTDNQKRP